MVRSFAGARLERDQVGEGSARVDADHPLGHARLPLRLFAERQEPTRRSSRVSATFTATASTSASTMPK